jgi:cytochrome c oxidase subunit 4
MVNDMNHSIVRPRTYLIVFAALIVLTLVTVLLNYMHLGEWHTAVGLVIASAKAFLIVLFFMHVLYAPRLTWVIALSGIYWFGILLALTMTDYLSRGWAKWSM